MDFSNIYQTGQQRAGGWRYPYTGRVSSVDTLGQQRPINAELLAKVGNLGLLDTTAQGVDPLTGKSPTGGLLGEPSMGGFDAPSSLDTPNGVNNNANNAMNGPIGVAIGQIANALGPVNNNNAPVVDATPVSAASISAAMDADPTNPSGMNAVNGMDSQSDNAVNGLDGISADGIGVSADGISADGIGVSADGVSADGVGDGVGGPGGVGAWAKGGFVDRGLLGGPNPKGADDGYGALDHGEFVLKAKTVKRLGQAKLKALNEGRADIVMKKGK